MKKVIYVILFALAIILLSLFFNFDSGKMELKSDVFENNEKIPGKYTCDGEDVSPQLSILNVPENSKSLVLIMDDPDAVKPAGKVWDHWIVFNIPIETKEILEAQGPQGVHGKGTSGNLNYMGPCPPDAEHKYFFKLFALDITLDLSQGSTKQEVEEAMQGHIIEQTELIGRYERIK